MQKGPVPPSRGNPVTWIPGPPDRKTGNGVASSLESPRKASDGHPIAPSLGNPVIPGHHATNTVVLDRVAPPLRSPKKASTLPPTGPNGHSLDPLLSSMQKGPVPPSRGNPVTWIPGPPDRKTGNGVASSLESPRKASDGHPIAPSSTDP
ncbi:vegetative cell wall protein gp1-like [Corylus avellana]|uniref:vegetative cell wall protein gp1-like n=1 Tax=Corylus avellana TaxID=13451 RepID=UPI00286C9DF4|nr:vegetative cell wall protein gp1-like [Corylus avellana]